MIDLKKEIEGLKNNINTEDYKYNMGCIVVKELENETIDKVLQLLDQYNIITAPKTIKLSEIVSRLKNELKDYVIKYINGEITVCRDRWCYAVVYIDEDTHNFEFDFHDRFNFPKWLYTLWIAGTIIEDDLKEDKQ